MGFFDRWRKRGEAPSAAATEEVGQMTVPEGHRVALHRMPPQPGVVSSAAGVWLAHLGVSSDEQEEEMDSVLREVEALLGRPRPKILLAAVDGQLSSLMAPANPPVVQAAGYLLWTVDVRALAHAPRAPALVQRLLRRMYVTSRASIAQTVFVLGEESAAGRAVVELFGELGLEVRRPDPTDVAVLAEVQRPEGIILSALLGAPIERAATAGSWAREVNEEKDRAASARARFGQLEEDERRELEKRLSPEGGPRRVAAVEVAPRLRRLLLAVAEDGSAETKEALYEELLSREIPLLFEADPGTRKVQLRRWPGGLEALAVYADTTSLRMTASDLGKPWGSFGAGEMTPAKLFSWAAGNGWTVAICVFNQARKPLYVPIAAEQVRALAAKCRTEDS